MRFTSLKRPLCLLLTGVISLGGPAMAAGPVEIRSSDVSLTDGVLTGIIVNSSAKPISGLNVKLIHGDNVIARATSDENGQFAISGLRNGGHVLQIGTVHQPVRFWETQQAPPSATARMAIVVDEPVVRGQESSLNNVLIPALVIGGALGVTLGTTLSADDKASAPASP